MLNAASPHKINLISASLAKSRNVPRLPSAELISCGLLASGDGRYTLGHRQPGSHHIFFCSSIEGFRLVFFLVFLPGAAFTVGAYSLEGGGRRHLRRIFGGLGRQQVLRGETNKKVWRVFFPFFPRRDATGWM